MTLPLQSILLVHSKPMTSCVEQAISPIAASGYVLSPNHKFVDQLFSRADLIRAIWSNVFLLPWLSRRVSLTSLSFDYFLKCIEIWALVSLHTYGSRWGDHRYAVWLVLLMFFCWIVSWQFNQLSLCLLNLNELSSLCIHLQFLRLVVHWKFVWLNLTQFLLVQILYHLLIWREDSRLTLLVAPKRMGVQLLLQLRPIEINFFALQVFFLHRLIFLDLFFYS